MTDENSPCKMCKQCGLPESYWEKNRDSEFCSDKCCDEWLKHEKIVIKKGKKLWGLLNRPKKRRKE